MNLNNSENSFNSESNSNSEKIKLISNSDSYWDKYWSKIDKAKNFIFIVTYDIDNKMIANLTLRKLMDAQERGVQVVLVVEHLNFYMKHSLYKQLKKKGVIIIKPNPMNKIFHHILTNNKKKFFNRSHQKVSLIDSDLFLGSINIHNLNMVLINL
jgi:phosphatidylserine/phosphatidylglycerophosphate/cardiolipin synthase-like enzyme